MRRTPAIEEEEEKGRREEEKRKQEEKKNTMQKAEEKREGRGVEGGECYLFFYLGVSLAHACWTWTGGRNKQQLAIWMIRRKI